jgi:hypothetical protein
MKPGDLRIGIGDGSIGGKAYLIIEVKDWHPGAFNGPLVSAICDGEIVRNPISWFEIKTRPIDEAG